MKQTRAPMFAAVAWALVTLPAAAGQQPPQFRSSVEVTSIDVSVVDDRGRPILGLGPEDFNVRVDGNARRVIGAEWVSLVAKKTAESSPLPEGYSSNENATDGRLIVLAVDQPNIRFDGARGLLTAATAFIDRLTPSDRIAAVGFGLGAPSTPFTADRARVKQALSRMAGLKQGFVGSDLRVALSEAIAIARDDIGALDGAAGRECQGLRGLRALDCRSQLQMEARSLALDANQEGDTTIRGLRELLTGLKAIDAPKTLVLMSEGFLMDDRDTDRVVELGALAAAARTSIYALRLDDQLFDITDARMPLAPMADRQARGAGLETLAAAARGALFTVTGSGAALFDLIEAEISGYYLLSVESDARDRNGNVHPVRIGVRRRGATVRSRQTLNTAADTRAQTPRALVAAGLSTPLLLSALPLRATTFALQGPEQSKVQILIHADVGNDFASSTPVTVGYLIADKGGRVVESHLADARLAPVMKGVPSALEYTAGASLEPGEYTLKLAVAEGDRVGSVEHPIHAALLDSGAVKLTELMVGGPTEVGDLLRPTIGYTASFGSVHGYLEAYGSSLDLLEVTYEIATDPGSEALVTASVPSRPAGDQRTIFTHVIVHPLPPGKYVLRALVSSSGQLLKTLTRAFEVTPPAVLMTSAKAVGTPSVSPVVELFLPIGDDSFVRPFSRDEALKPATLEPFRERVAPSAKDAFEKGVAFLIAGQYPKAEASLKSAIQPDIDSTAAMAYLAVCFAASGHDTEAAGAWETALVDGFDLPQLYQWLGDALLRTRELNQARSLLEEAAEKWPADDRFTKPLAMLYATFGRGREAARTLERYLANKPDDRDALYRGVEWIYHVHAAGAVVENRGDDLKLARTYADAYAKAKGPRVALVRQWIDFLEHEKRR